MKKLTLLILTLLFTLSTSADPLSGKWSFEAPKAPYDYNSGTVEFKNVNGTTSAVINFTYKKYEMKEMKETDKDIYAGTMWIDGEEVIITIDNTNGKMETSVNMPHMDMGITVKLKKCNK